MYSCVWSTLWFLCWQLSELDVTVSCHAIHRPRATGHFRKGTCMLVWLIPLSYHNSEEISGQIGKWTFNRIVHGYHCKNPLEVVYNVRWKLKLEYKYTLSTVDMPLPFVCSIGADIWAFRLTVKRQRILGRAGKAEAEVAPCISLNRQPDPHLSLWPSENACLWAFDQTEPCNSTSIRCSDTGAD